MSLKPKWSTVSFAVVNPPGQNKARILSFRTQETRDKFVLRFNGELSFITNNKKPKKAQPLAFKATFTEVKALLLRLLNNGDDRQTTRESNWMSHAHYDF